jgi:hypothetical protein
MEQHPNLGHRYSTILGSIQQLLLHNITTGNLWSKKMSSGIIDPPTSDRTYDPPNDDYSIMTHLGQCHGCGAPYAPDPPKRCSEFKRVQYCSRECQTRDWKKPHRHKQSCMEDLLPMAMVAVIRGWENRQISQTTATINCPDITTLLTSAKNTSKLRILSRHEGTF